MNMFEALNSSFFKAAFFYPKTLLLSCIFAVCTIIYLTVRLTQTKKAISKKNYFLSVYEDALSSLPDGYYLWVYNQIGFISHTRCSRRLAVMLNLFQGNGSSFDAFLERFSPTSAEKIMESLQILRTEHQSFLMEAQSADETKLFLLCGFRSLTQKNTPLLDILWVREITSEKKQISSLSEQVEELQQYTFFLRQAINSFPFPVWIRNEDLQLSFCNPAYAHAVHAASNEQAVLAGTELVYEKSPREARILAAAARAAGKEHKAREFVVMNGKRRRVEVSEIPLPAQGESFRSKTLGFVKDITREQELLDALQNHINSNNGVLEHLKTAIAVFDMETRLQFYNTSFLNLWDLEEEWLDGSPTYSQFLDILREKRKLPENRDFTAYKTKEVSYFSALVSAQENIMHLPSGITLRRMLIPHPLGGLMITYEDVTGHLTMERSVTILNETQLMLINQMREAILVFGSDGRLRLANDAYKSLWHVNTDEIKKSPPSIIDMLEKQKPFFETDKNWPSLKEQLLGVITAHTGEIFQILRSDGKILEFAAFSLPDGGIFVSFFDVTAEEKSSLLLAEKENLFSHYKQTTQQADKLRSVFIEQLYHEISSPLASLTETSKTLLFEKNKGLTKTQKSYIQALFDSTFSLKKLLDDMTDLALIEAGSGILELDSIDVPALLASAVHAMSARVKQKEIDLKLECEDLLPPIIADKKRLKQILYYLLSNAVDDSYKNAVITLTAATEEEGEKWLSLTISETSLDLKKKKEKAPPSSQTGFSATLIKNLIEMHDGKLLRSDRKGVKETKILLPYR